jgi:flagellar biosynthetic protein FliS
MTAMNNAISLDDYKLRIWQATPAQLVVINYELILGFLQCADEIETPKADKENFAYFVAKAKDGLTQLISGLKLELTLAQDLYKIYSYLYDRLTTAFFRYDKAPVAEALELLGGLAESFKAAAEQETKEAPPNIPQVISGLTYNKSGLSEYIDQDENRGYKA